jgi:hypothetical protein
MNDMKYCWTKPRKATIAKQTRRDDEHLEKPKVTISKQCELRSYRLLVASFVWYLVSDNENPISSGRQWHETVRRPYYL